MPAKRPNIVITIADDQPWYAMGGFNSEIRTPAQDALMDRGVTFPNTWYGGATVAAVCCPSRAQLFTGLGLFQIPNVLKGWWEDGCEKFESPNSDLARLEMLGELLRRDGYHCFGVGKWHNMQVSYIRNFNDGGAIYFCGGNPVHQALRKKPLIDQTKYSTPRPDLVTRGGHWNKTLAEYDGTGEYSAYMQYLEPRHTTEAFTESAVDFLNRYDGDEPFFLYVAYTAPHNPLRTHQHWHDQYPVDSVSLPENYMPVHPFDNGGLFTGSRLREGWNWSEQQCRQNNADLLAITAHMDEGIGHIHEALRQNGLEDDTIVIHTGDHGKSFGHHGLQGKWSLYEHVTRVPLVMAGPDIPRGQVSDELVYQHDLYPTLLEAAGIDVPETCAYETLRPAMSGSQDARQFIGCAYCDCMRSVRDDRWKLIVYNVEGKRHGQLYDLENDPHELKNLLGQDDREPHVRRLLGGLKAWQKQMGDPFEIVPAVGDNEAINLEPSPI